MTVGKQLSRLPRTQDSPIRLPNIKRSAYGSHFKVFDYHKDMEFEGIDIYITNSGHAVGRMRYVNNKLYIFKTTSSRIRPETEEWEEMETDIDKYINKRRREGSVLPLIEEDPTKFSIMSNISKQLAKKLEVDIDGLEKSNLLLNKFIVEIIKHEIPEIW